METAGTASTANDGEGDADKVMSDTFPGALTIFEPDLADSDHTANALAVPTIFPPRVANLITTLASSTRLTLSVVAFFIETILETWQFSTRVSLGYTRRLLISAITSARRVYLLSNAALSGDMLTLLDSSRGVGGGGTGFQDDTPTSRTDGFLAVLDRYTNLGIYVIHHSFTLAELFTMSGFYLAGTAVSSAHTAARESVLLLDSIFGSNESSRALASIIGLVRREVMVDERWKGKGRDKGAVRTLAGLTKAMTAFACLQNATWKKTSSRIRMKVIYDCTVHSSRSRRDESTTRVGGQVRVEPNPSPATVPDITMDMDRAIAGPGPSTAASRAQRSAPPQSSLSPMTTGVQLPEPTGVQPVNNDIDRLADELEELVGRDDIMELTDELTDSTLITQLLTTQGPGQDQIMREEGEEQEWIEVDNLLNEQGTSGLPSSPNASRIRARANPGFASASASTSEAGMGDDTRLHLVLRTITTRIMKRRRTFQRRDQGADGSMEMNTDLDMEMEATTTRTTPGSTPTPYPSPETISEPDSPSKTRSPSNRSSPFKALSQAKAAVARRLHLFSPSPQPAKLARKGRAEEDMDVDKPSDGMEGDESRETASPDAPSSDVKARKSREPEGEETPGSLFPHDGLVVNIHRFMRYSSAAYGQHFLRILGLGNSDYNFPSTAQHHFNSWAFIQHTNLAIDALLLTSHTNPGYSASGGSEAANENEALPLVHYVSVDHNLKAVVLTCRGTLGLSDILIDLTCDYTDITLDGADPEGRYFAHKGMYQSARNLTARDSTVHQGLVGALAKYEGYGLVICGHSLGGGVAAMFAIMSAMPSSTFITENQNNTEDRDQSISHPPITTPFVTSFTSGLPPGRPIHAYAYGPPALASPDLARYAKGLITSVVLNNDVVPCLSLGVLRDLKNIALTLYEEDKVAEEIIGRVAGLYKRRFESFKEAATGAFTARQGVPMDPPQEPGAVLSDWMMSLVNTMRADMDNEKLYPPGSVYIMEYHEIFSTGSSSLTTPEGGGSTTSQKAHRAILRLCESVEQRFREPLFTKSMLHDHLPSGYEHATQLLYDGVVHA